MLAGKTMDEAGRDNFKRDLLGETPKRAFAAVVDRTCKAVREEKDLEFTVHASFGDFPASDYLIQITLWDELSPVADEWRELGAFPPRVELQRMRRCRIVSSD
jgi:hypothetical protein